MIEVVEIPIVSVIWEDTSRHDCERMPLEHAKDLKIWTNFSVGYLIDNNDKSVIIANEIDTTENDKPDLYEGVQVIPKSCIVNMIYLCEKSTP
jgi:hypothetical protein